MCGKGEGLSVQDCWRQPARTGGEDGRTLGGGAAALASERTQEG